MGPGSGVQVHLPAVGLLGYLSVARAGALLVFLPQIDPYKSNYLKFLPQYGNFRVVFLVFMGVLNAFLLLANIGTIEILGVSIDAKDYISNMVLLFVGVLFYSLSSLMKSAKRNFFIGIRTPWTLASEKVWNKTHILGGKVFKLLAVLFIILSVVPGGYSIVLLLGGTFLGMGYLVLYSYLEFRKIKRKRR